MIVKKNTHFVGFRCYIGERFVGEFDEDPRKAWMYLFNEMNQQEPNDNMDPVKGKILFEQPNRPDELVGEVTMHYPREVN